MVTRRHELTTPDHGRVGPRYFGPAGGPLQVPVPFTSVILHSKAHCLCSFCFTKLAVRGATHLFYTAVRGATRMLYKKMALLRGCHPDPGGASGERRPEALSPVFVRPFPV